MSIFGTSRPRNRDRKRPGHPTQFAPVERAESVHTLQSLSADDQGALAWPVTTQRNVALDPLADTGTLTVLSRSTADTVRAAVAQNESCPQEVFESLAADPSDDVRAALATNPSLDPVTVSHLCRDAESHVVRTALRNQGASEETLARFYRHENWMYRESVASNVGCTESQFASLAADADEAVVMAVIMNKAVPASVIDRLEKSADQSDEFVMERIRRHPNRTQRELAWQAPGHHIEAPPLVPLLTPHTNQS
jgi:hypothetical protein